MAAAAVSRVRRAFVARLGAVLRLDDPPWRVALALAVGVFISCTPFWGLQTVLALAVATIFRLNRAVTVTGAWLNLPWFAPLLYGFALRIGALVLPELHGVDAAELVELMQMSSPADLIELVRNLSLALLIGTVAVGAVAGAVTYVAAFVFLRRRRAARMRHV